MDVDEAREQRLAVGTHYLRALGSLDVSSDRIDPATPHDDGAAIGILARGIEDRRAGDRDQLAARFGEHRLARPAKPGGQRRSRYDHLPQTDHPGLLGCLLFPLPCFATAAVDIPPKNGLTQVSNPVTNSQ